MVLMEFEYFIDEGKEEEYGKWSEDFGIPHWQTASGFKGIRIFGDHPSRKIKALIEFESFEAWGKAIDDPKTKKFNRAFASLTHGLKWKLWWPSERYPDTIKPL